MSYSVYLFFAIACAFSWGSDAVYHMFFATSPLGDAISQLFYMYGPAVAAIVVTKFVERQPLATLGPFWKWNRWLALAAILPIGFALLHVLLAASFPGVSLNSTPELLRSQILSGTPPDQLGAVAQGLDKFRDSLLWVILGQQVFGSILSGITVAALASFGEELGWRGYLQAKLSAKGFWRMALIIGVAWGIWHAPIILRGQNYPDHPYSGVVMMVAFCVLLSPIFSEVRNRAGSLAAVCFLHGVLNSSAGAVVFLHGGTDILVGPTGLAGIAVLALCNLWLWKVQSPQQNQEVLK